MAKPTKFRRELKDEAFAQDDASQPRADVHDRMPPGGKMRRGGAEHVAGDEPDFEDEPREKAPAPKAPAKKAVRKE